MYLEMIKTIPGIELNEGISSAIDSACECLDVSTRNLIVLDDFMTQSGGDKSIADLFTKGSHYRNLSAIYVVQNIFHQERETRNISLKAHYIVLFKSLRDKQHISVLARQVNPGHVQEFMKSYEEVTKRPHGYLMLDLKPTASDRVNNHPSPMTNIDLNRSCCSKKTPLVNKAWTDIFERDRMYNLPSSTLRTTRTNRWTKMVQAPLLTPNEKSTLYSNESNRFQSLQNQLRSQINLQAQLQSFLTTATKRLEAALKKPRYTYDQDSKKQRPTF